MNILITGAKGFVGKNLVANFRNIAENKNRTRPNLKIDEIYEYDIDSKQEQLEEYCKKSKNGFIPSRVYQCLAIVS